MPDHGGEMPDLVLNHCFDALMLKPSRGNSPGSVAGRGVLTSPWRQWGYGCPFDARGGLRTALPYRDSTGRLDKNF